jgi:hypothetical protein
VSTGGNIVPVRREEGNCPAIIIKALKSGRTRPFLTGFIYRIVY